jgi:hypothetical protein
VRADARLRRDVRLLGETLARKLTEAIWHILSNDQPFAPAGARASLAASTAQN